MTPTPSRPPKAVTPLWIIALFVSLTETVLGVAVTQTSGSVQLALTAFVVCFPVLTAAGFFAILWSRPYVFYSPGEFGSLDVQRYVEAMSVSRSTTGVYEVVKAEIQATLAAPTTIASVARAVRASHSDSLEQDLTSALEGIANEATERVRQAGFLSIDTRPLLAAKGHEWLEAFSSFDCVSDLLDTVYLHSSAHLQAYTYRQKWVLKDTSTGHVFSEMGRGWAQERGSDRDRRSLESVGIRPGMYLAAVPAP